MAITWPATASSPDRPDTTVVSREVDAVQAFFGFTSWPEQIVTFDLGGRVLEVTGSPGHHRAAITIYDPWSGFLLTGDTVLPGPPVRRRTTRSSGRVSTG